MADTTTFRLAMERNWDMISSAVADVDDATLTRQPNEQSNSMAWLIWHLTRVADRFVKARLQDASQLWVQDGWNEKFNMPADADDFGMGWGPDKLAAWESPSRDVLLGYFSAVNEATTAYVATLSSTDLERRFPAPPPANSQSVGEALGILVWDNCVHGGQIAYLRGYYQGMGWFR